MIFNIYVRAYQGSHKRSSDLPEYKPDKHHKHLESQVPTRHHCCGHYGLCIWYSHQKGYIKEMEWLDWPLHHTAFSVSKWNEYNTIIGQRILDLDTGLPLLYKTFLPLSISWLPSAGCWCQARYIPSCEVSSISAVLGGCWTKPLCCHSYANVYTALCYILHHSTLHATLPPHPTLAVRNKQNVDTF